MILSGGGMGKRSVPPLPPPQTALNSSTNSISHSITSEKGHGRADSFQSISLFANDGEDHVQSGGIGNELERSDLSISAVFIENVKIRPIDPRSRTRYEGVFEKILAATGNGSKGKGKGKAIEVESEDGEERLDGTMVGIIWRRSRVREER
jgi:hypothetical protein